MASKHREQRIIAAVACPQCGAPIGVSCRYAPGTITAGRLFCHTERRRAYQGQAGESRRQDHKTYLGGRRQRPDKGNLD